MAACNLFSAAKELREFLKPLNSKGSLRRRRPSLNTRRAESLQYGTYQNKMAVVKPLPRSREVYSLRQAGLDLRSRKVDLFRLSPSADEIRE